MKYIIVTGGVYSGVGKGVATSSIGALIKACGLKVTAIKIDPYYNHDAGLMSPREHGEVFVMDDGGEVDLDLGNYERFLDTTMSKMNNITTGKVNYEIYQRERKGDYLGRTVRAIPDVTDLIKDWIQTTAKNAEADVCLVELGGTIGDIEGVNFIEALRIFKFESPNQDVVTIQVDPVGESVASEELKTKPIQVAIKNSRQCGLDPQMLICRSKVELDQASLSKISLYAGIPKHRIFNLFQLGSVYQVPCFLQERFILRELSEILNIDLTLPEKALSDWQRITDIALNSEELINIALVGKYVQWTDTYTSVSKALEHACYNVGAKPKIHFIDSEKLESNEDNSEWKTLKSCSCLIVPGGFDKRGTEGMMNAIKWSRLNKVPFLGICLGFQLAVLEHARNVVGITNANSQEFCENVDEEKLVVIEMLEYKDPEHKLGGTMRLGLRSAQFTKPSILKQLYKSDQLNERHRHRFEVNPEYVVQLEQQGFNFVAQNDDGSRMEILELEPKVHPYFVGVQYHPEYLSRPFKPSPPFIGFINAARTQ